jgi:DNA-binding CsgD family transcriptional regulator
MLQALYQSLTPREQELFPLLASGLLNKQAAAVLGITQFTVQVHRGHIMRKMQADSFATLVRQASKLRSKYRRRPRPKPDANANCLLDSMTRRKRCPGLRFGPLP